MLETQPESLLSAGLATAEAVPSAFVQPALQRMAWRVNGAVQGVGFRPWCAAQAKALGLSGWVRNDGQGLHAELQGAAPALQQFGQRLEQAPPPLARITQIERTALPAVPGEAGFQILASALAAGETKDEAEATHSASSREPSLNTSLPADTAPCEACLEELFNPAERRYRHPFINCTQCGPRFTITERLPYDRPHTSLAGFPLCAACAAEYHEPGNRRHHAQPIACPSCGPLLALWSAEGRLLLGAKPGAEPAAAGAGIGSADLLAEAARRLRAGQVLAVKGVGGYHLICDALQAAPLARLRQAKQRASKPFALLAANPASARLWVQLDEAAEVLLSAPARSILLLPCQPGISQAHPQIAPGLNDWGLMLPATPLHWLLLHELAGRPADPAWRLRAQPQLLVMTSANPGGEPLVTTEAEAVAQLGGLADALLVHDRAILGRLDDSVRRPMWAQGSAAAALPQPLHSAPPALRYAPRCAPQYAPRYAPFVRRARGYVPEPVLLPGVAADAPPVAATGGWLKNTVCVTRGNEAFLSPHVGDLASPACRQALVEALERLCQFLAVRPQAVAHDLHPDFFSTWHAQALAAQWGVPALPVQHHHAHAAAVLAEHGSQGPALALVLDGSGLGSDGGQVAGQVGGNVGGNVGGLWGGELLRLEGSEFVRLAHLPLLAQPGGERAAREPWRMGAAVLAAAGRGGEIALRFAREPAAAQLATLIAKGLNSPASSSAGRWFDAAASLLGLVQHNQHEAEAAMRLEAAADAWAAQGAGPAQPWPGAWQISAAGELQWPGLCQRLIQAGEPGAPDSAAQAAAQFHLTLVAALADWVAHHAGASGLRQIALGGGCFINRWLRNGLVAALQSQGLQVLEAQQAPPGDGGLSLGQAAVALASLGAGRPLLDRVQAKTSLHLPVSESSASCA